MRMRLVRLRYVSIDFVSVRPVVDDRYYRRVRVRVRRPHSLQRSLTPHLYVETLLASGLDGASVAPSARNVVLLRTASTTARIRRTARLSFRSKLHKSELPPFKVINAVGYGLGICGGGCGTP